MGPCGGVKRKGWRLFFFFFFFFFFLSIGVIDKLIFLWAEYF
jgi:hypothetical protein